MPDTATFIEKKFDFSIPEEVQTAIRNLKEAVLSNSTLLDNVTVRRDHY